jgi:hypothetical protein
VLKPLDLSVKEFNFGNGLIGAEMHHVSMSISCAPAIRPYSQNAATRLRSMSRLCLQVAGNIKPLGRDWNTNFGQLLSKTSLL